MTDTLFSLI